jgi:hypothetical protein
VVGYLQSLMRYHLDEGCRLDVMSMDLLGFGPLLVSSLFVMIMMLAYRQGLSGSDGTYYLYSIMYSNPSIAIDREHRSQLSIIWRWNNTSYKSTNDPYNHVHTRPSITSLQ